MRGHKAIQNAKVILLMGFLVSSILVTAALAQSPAAAGTDQPQAAAAPSRYQANQLQKRAKNFYQLVWGIDSLAVKSVESGEIIRFTWRVLDADRAKILNDKKAEPSLIDPQAGVKLTVPSLDKMGQLRPTTAPEAGKSYWMVFSNKGRLVKRGDRVSVEIGSFKVDGLVVQ